MKQYIHIQMPYADLTDPDRRKLWDDCLCEWEKKDYIPDGNPFRHARGEWFQRLEYIGTNEEEEDPVKHGQRLREQGLRDGDSQYPKLEVTDPYFKAVSGSAVSLEEKLSVLDALSDLAQLLNEGNTGQAKARLAELRGKLQIAFMDDGEKP